MILSLINLILYSGLFYYGFLFNAVWFIWGRRLVLIAGVTLVFDFIFIEVFMEAFILMLINCKMFPFSKLLIKFFLTIKYLRNMN